MFAEPDLFSNAALSVADNGAFLVNLLVNDEIDDLELVTSMTGSGPDNPFESVANSRLGPLFIQLLVFLALLYAAIGIPFARLRDPQRRGRRSFVEHVETLGQRYAKARAARYAAGLYSGWALDRLRERVPGTSHSLHGLAQAIAARTGRDEAAVMRLLVEAHSLRENPGDGRSQGRAIGDLRIISELHDLLSRSGGAR